MSKDGLARDGILHSAMFQSFHTNKIRSCFDVGDDDVFKVFEFVPDHQEPYVSSLEILEAAEEAPYVCSSTYYVFCIFVANTCSDPEP